MQVQTVMQMKKDNLLIIKSGHVTVEAGKITNEYKGKNLLCYLFKHWRM